VSFVHASALQTQVVPGAATVVLAPVVANAALVVNTPASFNPAVSGSSTPLQAACVVATAGLVHVPELPRQAASVPVHAAPSQVTAGWAEHTTSLVGVQAADAPWPAGQVEQVEHVASPTSENVPVAHAEQTVSLFGVQAADAPWPAGQAEQVEQTRLLFVEQAVLSNCSAVHAVAQVAHALASAAAENSVTPSHAPQLLSACAEPAVKPSPAGQVAVIAPHALVSAAAENVLVGHASQHVASSVPATKTTACWPKTLELAQVCKQRHVLKCHPVDRCRDGFNDSPHNSGQDAPQASCALTPLTA
jgi:hypothetical protein